VVHQKKNPTMLTREDVEPHIIELASDDFMGRKPFTEGETKTVQYLEESYKALGIEPGNGESYFQDVPLVSILSKPSANMTIQIKDQTLELKDLEDYVIWTQSGRILC
jgi:hypothetical protein